MLASYMQYAYKMECSSVTGTEAQLIEFVCGLTELYTLDCILTCLYC